MKYQLISAVWELTMRCNMRCQHCGSVCEDALPDELTTEEALDLCDQLKELGLENITLSGGEFTTRKDWPVIAKRLVDNGIVTSGITNGWNITDEFLQKAKEVGINTLAISIDGLQETHDRIRKPGSFEKDIESIKKIKQYGMIPAVVTTIQKQNIGQLPEMFELLKSIGVETWQVQTALPMGNFKKHMDQCLEPSDIQKIIDFAYERIEDDMYIDLADCIGYYSKKDLALRRKRFGEDVMWQGCNAGKCGIGILCNGDIIGCTSIRGREFVEGNIRKTKLKDIWNSDTSFAWNRTFTRKDLKGDCKACTYADLCLGGCANERYTVNGDIHTENLYCAYNLKLKEYREKVNNMDSIEELQELLKYMLENAQYQVAGMINERLGMLCPKDLKWKQSEALIQFFCKEYAACKQLNEEILQEHPENSYARKGLGLALYRLGKTEEGIQEMYASLDEHYIDSYEDLYVVLQETGREKEAEEIAKKIQQLREE